jgi:hypothetical protein
MISKDEIKCAARRFAWRSCVRYVENKRNWEAGFNMGFKAAMHRLLQAAKIMEEKE